MPDATLRARAAKLSEMPETVPAHGPDRPHWMNIRAYGVTADGVAYDLPVTPREPGRCPVEGCHCQDLAL